MATTALTSEEARRVAAGELAGAAAGGTRRVVAGVTGPPGAGKSTFAVALVDTLNRRQSGMAAYLPMDGFHLANAQLDRLGLRHRKGAPDTFDVDGYRAAVTRVTDTLGRSDVYVPAFDRLIDEPVAAALVIPAQTAVIVTEGNYLALADGRWAAVRALIDRLYYVDADEEVRRRRLIERHTAGGRGEREARQWVDTVDEPNARVIAATRAACDRVFVIRDGPV